MNNSKRILDFIKLNSPASRKDILRMCYQSTTVAELNTILETLEVAELITASVKDRLIYYTIKEEKGTVTP